MLDSTGMRLSSSPGECGSLSFLLLTIATFNCYHREESFRGEASCGAVPSKVRLPLRRPVNLVYSAAAHYDLE